MPTQPRVLYAVLNWGLGHATRSIPVIYNLLESGIQPVIASDGLALELLKKRFPKAQFIALQSLNLSYSIGDSQLLHLTKQTPKALAWYRKERSQVKKLLSENSFSGIISDNRPAVFSKEIPSVYITHQLHVKAGIMSPIATILHQSSYNNFSSIWVPDHPQPPGLSGALGHPSNPNQKVSYIGPLSDLKKIEDSKTHGIGIILSGPEPQRSQLEIELINQLEHEKDITLVRGTNKPLDFELPTLWKVYDLAGRETVSEVYKNCETLIARCGYSTLMDLAAYPKPAILIPTPGQPEQLYLASMDAHNSKYVIQNQQDLNIKIGIALAKQKFQATNSTDTYTEVNWEDLFSLFKGK